MKRIAIVATMMAAACGYSEDKFTEDYSEASCDVLVTCFEMFDTVDACLAEGDDTGEEGECVNYDSAAAADCVDGVRAIADDCPDDIMDFSIPAVCGDICDIEADTGDDTDADTDSGSM